MSKVFFLIYLPLGLWLWKAPYGPRFRTNQEAPARAIRGLSDITATIRDIAASPAVITMILAAGGASLFVGNAHQAQMPEFARDLGYGGSGAFYSILLAANAAGALTAGLLLESGGFLQARPRTVFILLLMWCVTIASFAITTSYTVAVALLLIAGFLDLSYNSMAQTVVQLRAPPDIRGRVIGLYHTSHNGLRTFSGITVGVGGGIFGIHWSLAVSAGVLFAFALGLFAYTMRVGEAAAAAD